MEKKWRWVAVMLLVVVGSVAQDVIKVGILHSLTGTISISEATYPEY